MRYFQYDGLCEAAAITGESESHRKLHISGEESGEFMSNLPRRIIELAHLLVQSVTVSNTEMGKRVQMISRLG
jgi:hypothetical protein